MFNQPWRLHSTIVPNAINISCNKAWSVDNNEGFFVDIGLFLCRLGSWSVKACDDEEKEDEIAWGVEIAWKNNNAKGEKALIIDRLLCLLCWRPMTALPQRRALFSTYSSLVSSELAVIQLINGVLWQRKNKKHIQLYKPSQLQNPSFPEHSCYLNSSPWPHYDFHLYWVALLTLRVATDSFYVHFLDDLRMYLTAVLVYLRALEPLTRDTEAPKYSKKKVYKSLC